jgi:hypothetical protein
VCERHLVALRGKKLVEVAVLCKLQPGRPAQYQYAVKRPEPPQLNKVKGHLDADLGKLKAPAVTGKIEFELRLRIRPI